MTTSLWPRRRRTGPIVGALLVAAASFTAGCGAGTANDASTATAGSVSAGPGDGPASSTSVPVATGPTLVVTVPDLDDAAAGPGPSEVSAPAAGSAPAETAATVTDPPTTAPTVEPAPEPTTQPTSAAEPVPASEEAAPAAPATTAALNPSVDGLNLQLANCDGCTVLATHRDVIGDLSVALVSSPGGRALLLSVRGDGTAAGVINVPYGASFPTPAGGVLPCDGQGHCAVQGVQTDGRALLSAFALTDTGAWRNISGDDAFPSVTDRAAVVDLDGQLGLAVQDQGTGDPIWLLYRWLGDRFTVAGCAPDGDAPASVAAVSPDQCLS